jgi:hypothetical protein
MRSWFLRAAAAPAAVVLLLVLPATAFAGDGPTLEDSISSINTMWVLIAGVLLMSMQAGFAFLEIGFSRALRGSERRHARTGVRLRTGEEGEEVLQAHETQGIPAGA